MKKGITVFPDYDHAGRWCLRVQKTRGKFTLDEIVEAAMEYEYDFYAIIIKAMDEEYDQFFDVDFDGDYVTLYRATDFLKEE